MVITLTPDLEQILIELAAQQGTSPEQLALNSLREQFVKPLNAKHAFPEQETLFDFLADHIAVIHSSAFIGGGAHMSKNTRKKFVMGMLKKRAQEQL